MKKCPNCGAMNSESTCVLCGTIIPEEQSIIDLEQEKTSSVEFDNQVNNNEQIIQNNMQQVMNQEPINNIQNIQTSQVTNDETNNIASQFVIVEPNNNTKVKRVSKEEVSFSINKKEEPKINTSVSDEILIDAYIKKHQKRLKSGFSICTLLFNAVYILYRKMYLFGFFIMILNITIYVFTKNLPYYIMYILLFLLDFILAVSFKKLYMKHVKGKVEFAKMEFPNMSANEITEVCKIRGGTSIKAPIIMTIFISIMTSIILTLNSIGAFNDLKDDLANKTVKIDELSFKLPNILKEVNKFESLAYYETPKYNEKDYIIGNDCKLYMNVDDSEITEKWYKNSARAYLEEEIKNHERNKKDYDKYYNISKIKEKSIGNDLWLYFTIDADSTIEELKSTTYYYATVHNDKLYAFNFEIKENKNNYCIDAYNMVTKTLKFNK